MLYQFLHFIFIEILCEQYNNTVEDQQSSSQLHLQIDACQALQTSYSQQKPPKQEIQKDGFWYNEKGQKICGHLDTITQKRCRNPYQCRIHNPQQKQIISKEKSYYKKLIIGKWQQEEHIKFLHCVHIIGIGRWLEIASMLGSRNSSQCQVHYFKLKEKLGLTDTQMKEHLDRGDYLFEDIKINNQEKERKNKDEKRPSHDSQNVKLYFKQQSGDTNTQKYESQQNLNQNEQQNRDNFYDAQNNNICSQAFLSSLQFGLSNVQTLSQELLLISSQNEIYSFL